MNGTINNPHAKPRLDWRQVECEYLYGEDKPSLAELSRRHGVSYLTVHKYATRGKWERRRKVLEQRVHEKALERWEQEAVEGRIRRLRRLTRLVDNALDDAAVNPSEVLPHVIRLLGVERDVVENLPPSRSRERVLREHVERALTDSGLVRTETA